MVVFTVWLILLASIGGGAFVGAAAVVGVFLLVWYLCSLW